MDEFVKDIFNQDTFHSGSYPAVNIQEDDKQFTIEMAAPGLKKADFKINIEDHVLAITKEQEEKKEEVKDNYTRREFVYNHFSRSFRLPKTILVDKIKAEYKDGVLQIALPKDAKAQLSREISVN
jgi:HSP20 family protein